MLNFRPLFCLASSVLTLIAAPLAHAEFVIKDDTGQELRLKEAPKRIVSLAPHVTETLFAAGGGSKIVGTVDYSDYPEAAKKLPRVGGYSRVDLEAVAALKPDLIIAWQSGNASAQMEKIRSLGIPIFLTQPNTLDDVAVELEKLGKLAGTESIANAAASKFRERLTKLRQGYSQKAKVRVFYQIWKTPLMTVGGPQIISSAIQLCGGENVFGNLPQMSPTVSLEAVIAADPEAIVATGMGDARPDWLGDWNQWTRMTAVKRGNLFHINPDIMQRHTPRILDGTEKLCLALEQARSKRAK